MDHPLKPVPQGARDHLKKLGVPLSKRFKHGISEEKLRLRIEEIRAHHPESNITEGELRNIALAREISLKYQEEQALIKDQTQEKKHRQHYLVEALLFILVLILFTSKAHCQYTNVNLMRVQASTAFYDAPNNAIRVSIVAGGGSGGGPADVGLSTAASETDVGRQKVTSALRLWDQASAAGSQLVGWRGDTTNGAWVNCKVGCSATTFADKSTFTFGTTSFGPVGGAFDDTPPTALTTGQSGVTRLTPNRAFHINLRRQDGTEIGIQATPIFTRITDGTNNMPTGDAAARKIFVQPTDGTNNQGYTASSEAKVNCASGASCPVNATLQASSNTDIGNAAPEPSTNTTVAVSVCNILSAATTNSTSCKGSAGNFYGFELYNTTTTVYYLRFYNTATAPTCSSATGFIRSIPIPPAAAAGQVGGALSNQVFPVNYTTGIGYCITGGSSSTDNTNAAVGIFGEIRFK